MNWNQRNVEKAKRAMVGATSLAEGCRRAAASLDTTAKAVRLAYDRGVFGPAPIAKAAEPVDNVAALRQREAFAALKAANDHLVKELAEQQDKIAALTALRAAGAAPVVAPAKVNARQRSGVPVMLCSDWHVEERVTHESVNGLNEYNLDIADACITRLAEAFEWLMRDARYDCRAGVVWLGGDLFSGYIHDELAEGNFLSPVQAVVWLQDRLERMFRTIAATTNLERIIVPCNDGNHGRLTHKIRVATRTANSLEWLMYKTLAARLSDDPRFEFQIADSDWTFLDVFGKTLAFTHGDSFQYNGGVGGPFVPIRRGVARQFQGRQIHHVSMGHFHTRREDGDISINGSMIGYAPFAQRIHAAPEPRQQSWFMVDSERGKCLSAPIWLPHTGRAQAA